MKNSNQGGDLLFVFNFCIGSEFWPKPSNLVRQPEDRERQGLVIVAEDLSF